MISMTEAWDLPLKISKARFSNGTRTNGMSEELFRPHLRVYGQARHEDWIISQILMLAMK